MGFKKENFENKDNVSLDINLDEIFGNDISNNPNARAAFAQDIIDNIVQRTKKGQNWKEQKFGNSKYSEEYSDSLIFKAAGKSKSKVNLTLRGSMLNSIDLLESDRKKIKIGFNDEFQSNKAHGHITGQNGENPKMKRPFFNITEDRVRAIASKHAAAFERRAPVDLVTDFTRRQLESLGLKEAIRKQITINQESLDVAIASDIVDKLNSGEF